MHRATARATRPAQGAQRVRFPFSKMCTAPQSERFDPPKARKGFTLHFQNARRATARAIRPTQSAQRVRADCTTGPMKTTLEQTFARAFQANHLKTNTRQMRIPLHLQRKRRSSRNTAPAQQNDTSSLRSYDSRTGPTKAAHRKSSNSHVLRFPTVIEFWTLRRRHRDDTATTPRRHRDDTATTRPTRREQGSNPETPILQTGTLRYAFGKKSTQRASLFLPTPCVYVATGQMVSQKLCHQRRRRYMI